MKDLTIKEVYAGIAIIAGITLTFTGMLVAPVGIIDASILTALGILLTFAGSLLGIQSHYQVMEKKFETKINEKLENNNEVNVK